MGLGSLGVRGFLWSRKLRDDAFFVLSLERDRVGSADCSYNLPVVISSAFISGTVPARLDFFEIEMAQLELLDRVPVHRGVSCVVLASGTQNVTAVDYNRVREQWDSPRGVRSRTSAQGCILRCPCE